MNKIQKFNRALLKAIAAKKITVVNRNSGAYREAFVRFSFSHEGKTNFFSLSSIRTSPGLELFGFDNPPEIDLIENFNANFTSGCHVELPEGIDPSAIKYIEAYSVISQEDADKTKQLFVEYFNKFNVEMNSTI